MHQEAPAKSTSTHASSPPEVLGPGAGFCRTTEWFRLERTFKGHIVPSPYSQSLSVKQDSSLVLLEKQSLRLAFFIKSLRFASWKWQDPISFHFISFHTLIFLLSQTSPSHAGGKILRQLLHCSLSTGSTFRDVDFQGISHPEITHLQFFTINAGLGAWRGGESSTLIGAQHLTAKASGDLV